MRSVKQNKQIKQSLIDVIRCSEFWYCWRLSICEHNETLLESPQLNLQALLYYRRIGVDPQDNPCIFLAYNCRAYRINSRFGYFHCLSHTNLKIFSSLLAQSLVFFSCHLGSIWPSWGGGRRWMSSQVTENHFLLCPILNNSKRIQAVGSCLDRSLRINSKIQNFNFLCSQLRISKTSSHLDVYVRSLRCQVSLQPSTLVRIYFPNFNYA